MALETPASDELALDRRQLMVLAHLAADPDAGPVLDHAGDGRQAPPPKQPELDALATLGLVVDGRPHPDFADLARTVAAPLVRLVVDRVAPPPAVRCSGWITPGLAVLALPHPSGTDQILAVPTSEIVLRLAGLISLSPRPRARASAPPPDAVRLSFRLTTSWWGPGGVEVTREVAGVDAGDGWWLEDPGGGSLSPAAPSTIFRRLSGLLPKDAELGLKSGPSDDGRRAPAFLSRGRARLKNAVCGTSTTPVKPARRTVTVALNRTGYGQARQSAVRRSARTSRGFNRRRRPGAWPCRRRSTASSPAAAVADLLDRVLGRLRRAAR